MAYRLVLSVESATNAMNYPVCACSETVNNWEKEEYAEDCGLRATELEFMFKELAINLFESLDHNFPSSDINRFVFEGKGASVYFAADRSRCTPGIYVNISE